MALATVVHVEDSSYRRSGARMLITEDGNWTGGISGGCLEGDTLKKALYAIQENKAVSVRYDTRSDDASQIGVGLGCNGLIDVLITPLNTEEQNPIALLEGCTGKRTPSILITVVESSHTTLPIGTVFHQTDYLADLLDNSIQAQVESDIASVLNNRKSQTKNYTFTSGALKLFIEFLPPAIQLFIFGKNYDTIPFAEIAKSTGWVVNIVGNPLKISSGLYDLADKVWDARKGIPKIDEFSAALLMSHDYKTDKENLRLLSDKNISYIGILGPKKRSERIFEELKVDTLQLNMANVFAPMGLDTGATTPEEIAISIIAEIRTHLNKREGGFLRNRTLRINE